MMSVCSTLGRSTYLPSWISEGWLSSWRGRRSWTSWRTLRTVRVCHGCPGIALCLLRCQWHLKYIAWTWAWAALPSLHRPASPACGEAAGALRPERTRTTCCKTNHWFWLQWTMRTVSSVWCENLWKSEWSLTKGPLAHVYISMDVLNKKKTLFNRLRMENLSCLCWHILLLGSKQYLGLNKSELLIHTIA